MKNRNSNSVISLPSFQEFLDSVASQEFDKTRQVQQQQRLWRGYPYRSQVQYQKPGLESPCPSGRWNRGWKNTEPLHSPEFDSHWLSGQGYRRQGNPLCPYSWKQQSQSLLVEYHPQTVTCMRPLHRNEHWSPPPAAHWQYEDNRQAPYAPQQPPQVVCPTTRSFQLPAPVFQQPSPVIPSPYVANRKSSACSDARAYTSISSFHHPEQRHVSHAYGASNYPSPKSSRNDRSTFSPLLRPQSIAPSPQLEPAPLMNKKRVTSPEELDTTCAKRQRTALPFGKSKTIDERVVAQGELDVPLNVPQPESKSTKTKTKDLVIKQREMDPEDKHYNQPYTDEQQDFIIYHATSGKFKDVIDLVDCMDAIIRRSGYSPKGNLPSYLRLRLKFREDALEYETVHKKLEMNILEETRKAQDAETSLIAQKAREVAIIASADLAKLEGKKIPWLMVCGLFNLRWGPELLPQEYKSCVEKTGKDPKKMKQLLETIKEAEGLPSRKPAPDGVRVPDEELDLIRRCEGGLNSAYYRTNKKLPYLVNGLPIFIHGKPSNKLSKDEKLERLRQWTDELRKRSGYEWAKKKACTATKERKKRHEQDVKDGKETRPWKDPEVLQHPETGWEFEPCVEDCSCNFYKDRVFIHGTMTVRNGQLGELPLYDRYPQKLRDGPKYSWLPDEHYRKILENAQRWDEEIDRVFGQGPPMSTAGN